MINIALPAKNRRCRIRSEFESASGFTLIEVLIAMVVMAIGLLGTASMYVHCMHAGRTSQLRTQAVTLASDIADRIRANPQGASAYAGPSADNGCSDANLCSPTQLAAYDVWQWEQQRDLSMPTGTVVAVTSQSASANTATLYKIAVIWPEADAAPSYELQFSAARF